MEYIFTKESDNEVHLRPFPRKNIICRRILYSSCKEGESRPSNYIYITNILQNIFRKMCSILSLSLFGSTNEIELLCSFALVNIFSDRSRTC